jgi:hypothetical protein
MRTETARMIERIAMQSGVQSINIDSSVGGHDAGRHPTGNAVDIDFVNGLPINDRRNRFASRSLFETARAQPNIDEYHGPDLLERMTEPGTIDRLKKPHLIHDKELWRKHKGHFRFSRIPRNAEENTKVIAPPN